MTPCPTCHNLGFIDLGDCEDGITVVCPNPEHDSYIEDEDEE